jgi:hypothetical protein
MDHSEASRQLAAHAVVLRSSGAPHQQELADWIEAVVAHVNNVNDNTNVVQLENLRQNVGTLIDERDSARDACDVAARRIEELEQQLEEARKAPDGFVGVAKDVPEESHAALKADSKKPSGKHK